VREQGLVAREGRTGRVVGCAVLIWTFLAGFVAGAVDTDATATASFSVVFSETVRVTVGSAYVAHSTTTWDLFDLYFPAGGADPFGRFEIRVYAITGYELSLTKETAVSLVSGGTTTASVDIVDTLLEIRTDALEGDDDDGGQTDSPILDWAETEDWTPFPDGTSLLFHGGNTEGGALVHHRAAESLRINLEALRNNASGNVFTFTITVMVTET
jgi:hypothetical protein